MAVYCFKCDWCGGTIAVERPMSDCSKPQRCECQERMRRDFQAEQTTIHGGDLKWVISIKKKPVQDEMGI